MLNSRTFRLFSLLVVIFLTLSVSAQNSYELFNEGKEYREDGRKKKAIKKFEEALEAAEGDHNRQLQMRCHIELAELKDNVINYKDALDHYKAFTELYKKKLTNEKEEIQETADELADSVTTLETEVDESLQEIENKETELSEKSEEIEKMSKEQLRLEVDNQKKQVEILEQEEKTLILVSIIAIVVVVLAFFSLGYMRKKRTNKTLRNKNYQIAKEKQKSDELLLNILPLTVAEELKEYGKTTPSKFESATVMFTDFKGFTNFSERHTPEELVSKIDMYFSEFDKIMEKYGVEKIKTIGDAYLCVCGIPEPSEDHATTLINAAFEIRDYVSKTFADEPDLGLEMRIGIHTGPLVAGVVGSHKFAYDIWGDTVNIAARMEQSGVSGEINISQATYELIKDEFETEYRGEVEAKNKGKLKMYFVKGAL